MLAHRFAQGLVVAERQHDARGVAPVLELGQHALREAVERARDEQDVHGDLIDVCFKTSKMYLPASPPIS
ncbi:hypothetical protein D3C72_2331180 [compost metagenome]